MPNKPGDELKSFSELIQYAHETPRLKEFIQENYEMFSLLPLALDSIKSRSVHASGLIVFPEYNNYGNKKTVYDWVPVREEDGKLVTEWDGGELEELGFVKEDILGLTQVDKIKDVTELIQKDFNKTLVQEDIPLDDELTYEYFRAGLTQDVFQFNSSGMMGFLKEMRPDRFEDLAAANALYRPGAMASNFHHDYAKIKNGEKEPEKIEGCEEILKNTYHLPIYQEQIMQMVQELAGFSLNEADSIRKAIGKKDQVKMDSYKSLFVNGVKNNGRSEEYADKIWDIIEKFAEYSFNLAHSVAYAMIGYYSQYLKANYPLQFWTVAFQHSNDDNIPSFLTEIEQIGDLNVSPPDINNSGIGFTYSTEKSEIYWSITSIKNVGEVAVNKIIEERESNGHYFSFEEFYERIDKSKVNKRVIECLILAGMFDNIEGIQRPQDRHKLLKEYYKVAKIKEKDQKQFDWDEVDKQHYWILLQRELTGLGQLNLEKIYNQSGIRQEYLSINDFFNEKNVDKDFGICGLLVKFVERNTKNGIMCQLELDCNMHKVYCTVWNDVYEGYNYKKIIKQSENKLISLNGIVKYDNWKKQNVLMSNSETKIVRL